jgi:apolipoprotein D and lipocalin family protein
MRYRWQKLFGAVLATGWLAGCVGTPEGIEPVAGFELDRYLGKWYEIARLDHSFERGLEQVSAEYSLRDDGSVKVINRGFSVANGAWREAEGKAYFVRKPDEGYLKVSFFGPFYGAYVVFELDHENYQYSFVTGPNRSYLWLLSRSPVVSPEVLDLFVDRAQALGFATDELIFVDQGPSQ